LARIHSVGLLHKFISSLKWSVLYDTIKNDPISEIQSLH